MSSVAEPAAMTSRHHSLRSVWPALALKEWREQRWRFFLGTVVLTGMLAGTLRAQIITPSEAALFIYWPVGVVLAVFLAMGPVATERADRTWEFLVAQPISRADVLFVKWGVGLMQLVGMMVIATAAGGLALWSRDFSGPTTWLNQGVRDPWDIAALLEIANQHPVAWLCRIGLAATVALASWYTPLFLILTRARNEFTAALGGLLLTIALHFWLAQFVAAKLDGFLIAPAILNPLSPIALLLDPPHIHWLPAVCLMHIVMWLAVPIVLMRRLSRRATVK
jgi:ABC-type Na+ efflux pump permease subunit